MRPCEIEAMLTELSTVPISSSHIHHKIWNSVAGIFVPINNPVTASRYRRQDKPPHFHPVILLGSQYAARANSMYGAKVLRSICLSLVTVPRLMFKEC